MVTKLKDRIQLLLLYFNTIKYLKLKQTFGRTFAAIKRKYLKRKKYLIDDYTSKIFPQTNFIYHDPWNNRKSILKNEFTFLNLNHKFNNKINWQVKCFSLLWQFNLHYFNYLYLLKNKEKEKICLDWVLYNEDRNGVGWMPYPLSLRIINWCKADIQNTEIQKNLYIQAAFLNDTIEYYFPGNHLLENARALIYAGCYFYKSNVAKNWLDKGLKIFNREIKKQVLPDGSFFELSPMYHSLILENYLDIANLISEIRDDEEHIKRIQEMCNFLKSVAHPDGNLVLFNDSSQEIAPDVNSILEYAKRLMHLKFQFHNNNPTSGIFIHRTDKIFLAIDGGEIGPDYLPAHSHADIFNYELSIGENKIIVDSGTYNYSKGRDRDYFRSTAAHNTICIDKINMAECWDKFRVGRRFKPKNVKFQTTLNQSVFSGDFDGYSHLIGDDLKIERKIVSNELENKIEITDQIDGKGKHLSESFIHLNPFLKYEVEGDNIKIFNGKEIARIKIFNKFKIEHHYYSPKFNIKYKNPVIVLNNENHLPSTIKYVISY